MESLGYSNVTGTNETGFQGTLGSGSLSPMLSESFSGKCDFSRLRFIQEDLVVVGYHWTMNDGSVFFTDSIILCPNSMDHTKIHVTIISSTRGYFRLAPFEVEKLSMKRLASFGNILNIMGFVQTISELKAIEEGRTELSEDEGSEKEEEASPDDAQKPRKITQGISPFTPKECFFGKKPSFPLEPNPLSKELETVDRLKRRENLPILYKLEERKPGYCKGKNGGLECHNREELASQEGIVLDLIKSAGKTLMEGRNIISISLPVRIFEPRSTLERLLDIWCFGPIYLRKAADAQDSSERMRMIMTFVMSGLHNGAQQLKPFNPIIGETYNAFWPDGTAITIEHTSHHPPISHFFVEDSQKKYKIHGYYEYKAKLKGNIVIGKQAGPSVIEFSDGEVVEWVQPEAKLSGLLWGTRTLEWTGDVVFDSKKANLHCSLKFGEGSGYFSKGKHTTDYFE